MSLAGLASPSAAAQNSRIARDMRPIRIWLWSVAALVFLMVVVGGATRLTESGLSITEWKLVTGILPPLSEAAWLAEFEAYKRIPQYSELFPTMSLSEFKFIFFWEWGHRLLGRLIGVAFAGPYVWFWARGYLTTRMKWQFGAVLALGGLQGAVGWWMVTSGLAGRVEVAPERLAVHLLLASITFTALVWLAVGLRPKAAEAAPGRLRVMSKALVGLTLFQIGLGGLVAGSRAGLTYNTWPLMDGRFIPPSEHLFDMEPLWLNFLENITTIQFDHRIGAYVLLALAIWHWIDARRTAPGSAAYRRAATVAGLVIVQAGLGIATLLLAEGKIPLWPALLHQAVAMFVLGMAVVHARRLSEPGRPAQR